MQTEKEGNDETTDSVEAEGRVSNEPLVPGALPKSADHISKEARALLLRLLERNPRYRLKSLKHLKESAFYMGFNFEDVKSKKISPKCLLEQCKETQCNFINNLSTNVIFENFEQKLSVI
ncbi:unnamed protein product [Colias eurytheme]|nr:unnamed protein product [Colias eurytheme]